MFEKATRTRTALWCAISSAAGAGKTYSALRLATGIQRVFPGPIRGIDTEHGRMSHYAKKFAFDVREMSGPYRSGAYLELIRAAITGVCPDGTRYGPPASCVIIDSMSHEHSGPGGYLAYHQEETKRLMAQWRKDDPEAVQFPAYAAPAQERRAMIDGLVHLGPCNLIFCFRSKHGAKKEGRKVVDQGWIPVGSEELWFEMGIRFLLPPGADGRPDWSPTKPGEKEAIKLPGWARDINMSILSEDVGEELARWALGDANDDAQRAPEARAYDAEHKRLLDEIRAAVRARGLSKRDDPERFDTELYRCFNCDSEKLPHLENADLAAGLELLRRGQASEETPVSENDVRQVITSLGMAKEKGYWELAELVKSWHSRLNPLQVGSLTIAAQEARKRLGIEHDTQGDEQ